MTAHFIRLIALVLVITGLNLAPTAMADGYLAGAGELTLPPDLEKPTDVVVSLYLDDVSNINVSSSIFDITGQLVLDWRDERLRTLFAADGDCQRREYQGAAALQKLTEIWSPQLEIMNEKGQRRTGVLALEIECDGDLKLYERFSSTPRLEGNMHAFPFVDANLKIAFSAFSQPSDELALTPGYFEFQPGARARDVIAGDWQLTGLKSSSDKFMRSDMAGRPMDQTVFIVKVERRLWSGFVIFLLPLIMIGAVSSANIWLDAAAHPSYSGPRIGGTITLMLTTVAFQLSLETRMPTVDYIVLVQWQIWLTMLMLTLSVMFSCGQVWLFHNNRSSLASGADRLWRVGYPAVFALASVSLAVISFNDAAS